MSFNTRKVFIPLRSNANWFLKQDSKTSLTNQLKFAILLYDELLIEDGTYEVFLIGNTLFVENFYPPGNLTQDERVISQDDVAPTNASIFVQPGGPNNPLHEIASGQTTRLKADFFELLKGLDLTEHSFIQYRTFKDSMMPPQLSQFVEKNVKFDMDHVPFTTEIPYLREIIIKNVNRDLAISNALRTASLIDLNSSKYINNKRKVILQNYSLPDNQASIAKRLFEIKVPNFSQISMEEVIELRNNDLWQSFRNELGNISSQISTEPDLIFNQHEYDQLINTAIMLELTQEIESRTKDGVQLAADIFLGALSFLPPPLSQIVTGWGMLKSLSEYSEQQNSWYAFLLKASKL